MQDLCDLMRGLYAAFSRGEIPVVLAAFSPDLVWHEAENFIYSEGSPYKGPEAVLTGVFARLATEWDGFTVVPEEFIGSSDTVVVPGRYRGTYKATGVRVDAQFVHVWRFRDGQVTTFRQCTDTAQFRDATAKAARA